MGLKAAPELTLERHGDRGEDLHRLLLKSRLPGAREEPYSGVEEVGRSQAGNGEPIGVLQRHHGGLRESINAQSAPRGCFGDWGWAVTWRAAVQCPV